MNENKKSKVWVYAVILFTSAFVILLLTAYSQIKLNKNLSDYKNQVSSQETEKKKVQQNFSSAQEMNVKLNAEIKKLQEENNTLRQNIYSLDAEKAAMQDLSNKKNAAAESFSNVMNLYLNGKILECAGIIDSVDAPNLELISRETYKTLVSKVKSEAGKLLFEEGLSLYNSGKYNEAAAKLLLSSQYAASESYSDRCLFYLAYSEAKLENKTAAVEYMNKLIGNYPESRYLRNAKRFVEKYK